MPLERIVICSRMVLMTLTNVKLSIWTSASGASAIGDAAWTACWIAADELL